MKSHRLPISLLRGTPRSRCSELCVTSGQRGKVAQRIALSGQNRLDPSAETRPHVIPGTQPGIDTEVSS